MHPADCPKYFMELNDGFLTMADPPFRAFVRTGIDSLQPMAADTSTAGLRKLSEGGKECLLGNSTLESQWCSLCEPHEQGPWKDLFRQAARIIANIRLGECLFLWEQQTAVAKHAVALRTGLKASLTASRSANSTAQTNLSQATQQATHAGGRKRSRCEADTTPQSQRVATTAPATPQPQPVQTIVFEDTRLTIDGTPTQQTGAINSDAGTQSAVVRRSKRQRTKRVIRD